MADDLARLVHDADEPDAVVDLFAGAGHFAARFADRVPITACDASAAATTVLSWRLTSSQRVGQVSDKVRSEFLSHRTVLRDLYKRELHNASIFQAKPSAAAWLRTEGTFGQEPGTSRQRDDWSLVTSYFGNAYFGLDQAVSFDALRMALEHVRKSGDLTESEYLTGMVGLLCAATHLTNAPGHFAQFFDITDENAESVAHIWSRDVWEQWLLELSHMRRAGTARWRRGNTVHLGDSLDATPFDSTKTAIYADPPYTSAQYSRFYHLLDTLVLYDYPACEYGGRYRSGRFKSRFCGIRTVEQAFQDLFIVGTTAGSVLYLTYPTNGVLQKAGASPRQVASDLSLQADLVHRFDVLHSAPGRHKNPEVIEEVWRIRG